MRITNKQRRESVRKAREHRIALSAPAEDGYLAPQHLLGDIAPNAVNGSQIWTELAKSTFAVKEPDTFLESIIESFRWNFIKRPALNRAVESLQYEIQKADFGLQAKKREAAEQGTVVDPALNWWGLYDNAKGTVDPTGITFDACREFVYSCEPLSAIVNKLSTMAGQYHSRALSSSKFVDQPGFRIKLTNRRQARTKQDEERIEELEQFMEEAGYTPPPDGEKPMGWTPGFESFLRSFTLDAFTLDWTCVRMWADANDPVKYPIVSFAVVDSAVIRRRVAFPDGLNNDNTVNFREVEPERKHAPGPIRLCKVDPGGAGRVIEEYASHEMKAAVRRPNTDESANGYGLSEVRQAFKAISIWAACRDYNSLRFDKDALPRGVLSVLAAINEQQFQAFQLNWAQMAKGLNKRWNTPILKGNPQTGAAVSWTPFDMSNRDMEYSQFQFAVALWIHAIFGMSPDETGFASASPFRPPLSEASPETNLKYSQDTCFRPYMKFLEHWINHNILWVIEPSRRYKFEFVGLGDYDEEADIQMRTARLAAGITTPRMEWEELDITMPDAILNHPAADFPAPFMQGFTAINQLAMQQKQMDDQDAMMQQQQQQQNAQQHAVNNNPELAAQLSGQPDETGGTGSADAASQSAQGSPLPPQKYSDLPPQQGDELQKAILATLTGHVDTGTTTRLRNVNIRPRFRK
jgi:hypothetical protein